MAKDSLYAQPLELINEFVFDENVAHVFPDMIKRSVPGYATVIGMSGVLASLYAQPGSACYDLGCSLGATSLSMQQNIHHPDCSIIAVDNSEDMLKRAKEILGQSELEVPVNLVCDDLFNINIKNASVVAMNYTLQFIDESWRAELIKKIFEGLLPGGVFLLSEKIRFEDLQQDERMISMHHEFKRANGYSDLEISQKRTALENVLKPETLQQHVNRLETAGFKPVDNWFGCFNFISLIAHKPT